MMSKKYYIYHIPGVKIGCTDNIERRVSRQGFSDYEILEEYTDIYKASEREIELQKKYGYKVDKTPYWKLMPKNSKGGKIGGKVVGEIHKQSGHMSKLGKARKKPILVYSLDNKFISEYESGKNASEELNILTSGISSVLNNKFPHYKGYIFKYKE